MEPCIPTRVSKPPVGSQWVHEIKHDGYEMVTTREASGMNSKRESDGWTWCQCAGTDTLNNSCEAACPAWKPETKGAKRDVRITEALRKGKR
jgi:hypothetical protein